MRKFLLALIACLVAVIAYASPGSPYLSYGWRAGGGGAALAWDGAVVSSNSNVAATTTNITFSTTQTNDLIVCGLNFATGTAATGIGITGGSLTWHVQVTASRTSQVAAVAWAWAATTLSSQTLTASWTNSNNYGFSCRAIHGSKDYTGLTPGTNYGTATNAAGTCTDCTISTTTIGTSGSWIVCAGQSWTAAVSSYDSGTTSVSAYAPGGGLGTFWMTVSSTTLSAGAHTLGVTLAAADNNDQACMEILLGP